MSEIIEKIEKFIFNKTIYIQDYILPIALVQLYLKYQNPYKQHIKVIYHHAQILSSSLIVQLLFVAFPTIRIGIITCSYRLLFSIIEFQNAFKDKDIKISDHNRTFTLTNETTNQIFYYRREDQEMPTVDILIFQDGCDSPPAYVSEMKVQPRLVVILKCFEIRHNNTYNTRNIKIL